MAGSHIYLGANSLKINDSTAATFAGVISDGGSAGGTGGALIVKGTVPLALTGANTFTGGVSLQSGILELSSTTAAGVNDALTFASAATLQLDAGALNGTGPQFIYGTAIAGFNSSDHIDLASLNYASGATATYDGATLVVRSGGAQVTLTLTGLAAGSAFTASNDGQGHVLIGLAGAQPAPPSNSGDTLLAGQQLAVNQCLTSATSTDHLCLQNAGNVVFYAASGAATWATAQAAGPDHLVMQDDGNLVEYATSGAPIWASNTAGQSGAYARVEPGRVVIYDASNQPIWVRPTDTLTAYQFIDAGDYMRSADGQYELDVQTSGNLYLWNIQTNQFVWQSGTATPAPARLRMNPDGNLVLFYNDAGGEHAVWWTCTDSYAGSHFVLQTDGNIVVYDPANTPRWDRTSPVCTSN